MIKCIASKDGVCRNMYAFGIKCNGYSSRCKLKPHYDELNKVTEGLIGRWMNDLHGCNKR